MRAMWEFGYAFRSNNNVRLAAAWSLVMLWLTFNLLLSKIETHSDVPFEEEVLQQTYNYYLHSKWATNEEMQPIVSQGVKIFNGLKNVNRVGWRVFAILVLVYTPMALREEIGGVLERFSRFILERRRKFQDVTNPRPEATSVPPTTAGGTPHSPQQRFPWVPSLFLVEMIELMNEIFRRNRH